LEREREESQRRDDNEKQLREQLEKDARELEDALRNAPEREVKDAIVDELKAAGLLRETAQGLSGTLQLIDRFASLVYEDEMRTMGGRSGAATGEYAEGEGHYIRGPLRSAVETSRMDILASRIRARSRHPHVKHMVDDDVVVYREERTSAMHVVLIVDRSGSMEENGRLDAAKRATLALHHAVRRRNARNRVDILLMDTSVRPATLRDVWETEPTGFTNTGAALRLARELARRRHSDRLLVYLVTDGLPEAYTRAGEDVAGHPDKAMAYAREQAKLLRRERGLAGFVMLLLEPEDERYVKAAEALAKEAGGRVQKVDPKELASTLLRSFETTPSTLRV
ncbi:MAG: VWA domain-containing protein, partial [Candidatus Thermoplasmatota archaeon]